MYQLRNPKILFLTFVRIHEEENSFRLIVIDYTFNFLSNTRYPSLEAAKRAFEENFGDRSFYAKNFLNWSDRMRIKDNGIF